MSPPKVLPSDSVSLTSKVEPSKIADDTSNKPIIAEDLQDATMSETVPVRCYPAQA